MFVQTSPVVGTARNRRRERTLYVGINYEFDDPYDIPNASKVYDDKDIIIETYVIYGPGSR